MQMQMLYSVFAYLFFEWKTLRVNLRDDIGMVSGFFGMNILYDFAIYS